MAIEVRYCLCKLNLILSRLHVRKMETNRVICVQDCYQLIHELDQASKTESDVQISDEIVLALRR